MHKFSDEIVAKNNAIALCGMQIPHDKRLLSNSDGDVAIHALVDAILGSIADRDIGHYFSPKDSKWQNYTSDYFLKFANKKLHEVNYRISNIDMTIVCEKPKISIYRDDMRKSISDILEIDITQVSIKGTTTETLGFTGRQEGIATYAIVMISPI